MTPMISSKDSADKTLATALRSTAFVTTFNVSFEGYNEENLALLTRWKRCYAMSA